VRLVRFEAMNRFAIVVCLADGVIAPSGRIDSVEFYKIRPVDPSIYEFLESVRRRNKEFEARKAQLRCFDSDFEEKSREMRLRVRQITEEAIAFNAELRRRIVEEYKV
jgi:hypothetical protein